MVPVVLDITSSEIRTNGVGDRLAIAPTAQMTNTCSTLLGRIHIGDFTFAGHNVSILTGTHQVESLLQQRMTDVPGEGRDVIVGRGVWLGSNSVILGPCTIGDHAVVAAGAVVAPGTIVPPGAIVGGVPARIIKAIDPRTEST